MTTKPKYNGWKYHRARAMDRAAIRRLSDPTKAERAELEAQYNFADSYKE